MDSIQLTLILRKDKYTSGVFQDVYPSDKLRARKLWFFLGCWAMLNWFLSRRYTLFIPLSPKRTESTWGKMSQPEEDRRFRFKIAIHVLHVLDVTRKNLSGQIIDLTTIAWRFEQEQVMTIQAHISKLFHSVKKNKDDA